MKIPDNDELLAAIRTFLDETGMAPSRFGRDATGEPQLIASLEAGRSPSLKTARKAAAFMEAHRQDRQADHVSSDNADAGPLSGRNDDTGTPCEIEAAA